jgi:hypothetical protein
MRAGAIPRRCAGAVRGARKLVQVIDLEKATGLLAARYAPERYQEVKAE